jgi:hypothetical protein
MEPEPQYPVDAITTEAMKASEPVGMDMSLDDIVKQHRVANKKRGDGKLSRDERLKVKLGLTRVDRVEPRRVDEAPPRRRCAHG